MAAITTVIAGSRLTVVREGVSTAQTDWVTAPAWASAALISLNITAAGTNTQLTIVTADPVSKDDAHTAALFTGGVITATGQHWYDLRRSGSSASGDTDATTGDDYSTINAQVPALMGLTIAVTGEPTYTLAVQFRR